jgi:rhodanese-related sulfurtransferase
VARRLKAAGWNNARALRGGWAAWKDAGLPVQLKDGAPIKLKAKA